MSTRLLIVAWALFAVFLVHGAFHVDDLAAGWGVSPTFSFLTPCVKDPACHAVLNGTGYAAFMVLWVHVRTARRSGPPRGTSGTSPGPRPSP